MKKLALIVAAVVVLAGGVLTYAYIRNTKEADRQNAEQAETAGTDDMMDMQDDEMMEQEHSDDSSTKSKDTTDSKTSQPGAYVEYSSDAVAKTDGTKLLFFHASWCPQCQMIDADIKKQGVPDGVTVFKVDYDSNQALRQKYGVTLQTTFVKIDDNGNLIKKFVAYNEPNFDSVKQNLL